MTGITKSVLYFDAPIGGLALHFAGQAVCGLDFFARPSSEKPALTPAMRELARQLRRYFSSPGHSFRVPVHLRGSAFQLRVWQALRRIPAGETRTYGQLAAQLGSSARAVGNACRRNPLPIIVPCHRVVAASGPGGFCGKTGGPELEIKYWLLRHEGAA